MRSDTFIYIVVMAVSGNGSSFPLFFDPTTPCKTHQLTGKDAAA